MTNSGANLYYFVIVAKHDNPIYEVEFTDNLKKDTSHLNEFVVYSCLDILEETVWRNPLMNLKQVTTFGDLYLSAFVTAGGIRLLLLHEVRNEEAIRSFFQEVYELYVKELMNPFYSPNSPLSSAQFDQRVKLVGKRIFATRFPEVR